MSDPDLIVQCRCGWFGLNNRLNNAHCPVCDASFTAWPARSGPELETYQRSSDGQGEAI